MSTKRKVSSKGRIGSKNKKKKSSKKSNISAIGKKTRKSAKAKAGIKKKSKKSAIKSKATSRTKKRKHSISKSKSSAKKRHKKAVPAPSNPNPPEPASTLSSQLSSMPAAAATSNLAADIIGKVNSILAQSGALTGAAVQPQAPAITADSSAEPESAAAEQQLAQLLSGMMQTPAADPPLAESSDASAGASAIEDLLQSLGINAADGGSASDVTQESGAGQALTLPEGSSDVVAELLKLLSANDVSAQGPNPALSATSGSAEDGLDQLKQLLGITDAAEDAPQEQGIVDVAGAANYSDLLANILGGGELLTTAESGQESLSDGNNQLSNIGSLTWSETQGLRAAVLSNGIAAVDQALKNASLALGNK